MILFRDSHVGYLLYTVDVIIFMKRIKSGIEIRRSQRSLAVVAGMKKQMIMQNRQKSNAEQIKICSKYQDSKLRPFHY